MKTLDPLSFPLQGARLIEASAGTGKTYTIAALYLRLVLGHGGENGFSRPLLPPEILVVTFTRLATQELRQRIRQRLAEAAAVFRGESAGDKFLEDLRQSCRPEDRAGNARVLSLAARNMDEAAIHTIHGWCQKMLRHHAFESGSLFDLEVLPAEKALRRQAAADYWREYYYPLAADRLDSLISALGCSDPDSLARAAAPYTDAPPVDFKTIITALDTLATTNAAARQVWQKDSGQAIDRINTAITDGVLNKRSYNPKGMAEKGAELADWVNGKALLPSSRVLSYFSADRLNARTRKGRTAPRHPAFDAIDRLAEAMPGARGLKHRLLTHAAREIRKRMETEKKRQGCLGYDDLVRRLDLALRQGGAERLARIVRRQFPVAMIDEFQDTDPLQYAVFKSVYLTPDQEPTALVLIGDPKQSIYAFRGADIDTYLAASRQLPGQKYTLGTNYRSVEGLVAAVNRLFTTARKYPEGPFLAGSEIDFTPVQAHAATTWIEEAGAPLPPFTFWQLTQTEILSKTGARKALAAAFAAGIADVLRKGAENPPPLCICDENGPRTGIRPRDIAVLVRDKNEAGAIQTALSARGVQSVYLSEKQSVFKSAEARDLYYVLQACADPENRGRVKTALASGLFNFSPADLIRLQTAENEREAALQQFGHYHRLWQRQGVLPMLRALLHDHRLPGKLCQGENGERRLTNLLHLAELLHAQATQVSSGAELLDWLHTEMVAEAESEDQVLRLESDAERVRIVTVHKSKGLEYPLVFLPFISIRHKSTGKEPGFYPDANGQKIWADAPDEEQWRRADRQRLAEELRLLYVALTRARHACFAGTASVRIGNGKLSRLHESALGYLLNGGEHPIEPGELTAALKGLRGECAAIRIAPLSDGDNAVFRSPEGPETPGTARTFTGSIRRDWWIASYSALLNFDKKPVDADPAPFDDLPGVEPQTTEIPPAPQKPTAPLSIHHFPQGPLPGIFLHELLEWAAVEGFDTIRANPAMVAEKINTECARRDWVCWAPMLCEWLPSFLNHPLALAGTGRPLRLAELPRNACQPEMDFMFAVCQATGAGLDAAVRAAVLPKRPRSPIAEVNLNGMLKGLIDLVFCHEERYFVLDYKSNRLGGDTAAYTDQAMTEAICDHRYDLQLVIYCLALHRLLKARLPGYDYGRDVGGSVYLFLRGIGKETNGIFCCKPPLTLIEELDQTFRK